MARKIYGNDQVLSHGDYLELGVDGCRNKAFVSGHFGYEFAKPLMEGRYSFTFLRDPHERLLSLYRYCRARTDIEGGLYESARKYDVAGFLKATLDSDCRSHVWNNQVWQLAYGFGWTLMDSNVGDIGAHDPQYLLDLSKKNLSTFDQVGLVETFDQDIQQIFADLGHPLVEINRSNVTASSTSNVSVSGALARLMDDITELDRALYDHVLQMRQGRFRTIVSRFSERFLRRA